MDDVFVLPAFLPPYESPEPIPLADLAEEVPLAEGDFWCGSMTYFEIMADPDYAAWVAQAAALQAYAAATTLEEILAITAPFQGDFAVV